MIRPTVVALALCVVSSAQSMPYVPLQQPNNSVIPVRQGCGLGRQLVDGICVSNAKVRAAVRKCSSRNMRMVNGRCEPRARPAAASGAARPSAQPPAAPQPAATLATPRWLARAIFDAPLACGQLALVQRAWRRCAQQIGRAHVRWDAARRLHVL